MVELVVFAVLSLVLALHTWLRPHRHRFYRFIAFESLLGLVLLNARAWFNNPFSAVQIVSWVLLVGSAVLALHGFRMLRTAGEPDGDIENTTRLVTSGAYRYIRHPLYSSLLMLGTGAFLKHISLPGGIILAALAASLVGTALVEEKVVLARFGEDYRDYMKRTKRFIPFLF